MRVFFNAGGSINISGTIGRGNTTINNDWRNLMSAVGTVVFDRDNTSNGSEGTSYWFCKLTRKLYNYF